MWEASNQQTPITLRMKMTVMNDEYSGRNNVMRMWTPPKIDDPVRPGPCQARRRSGPVGLLSDCPGNHFIFMDILMYIPAWLVIAVTTSRTHIRQSVLLGENYQDFTTSSPVIISKKYATQRLYLRGTCQTDTTHIYGWIDIDTIDLIIKTQDWLSVASRAPHGKRAEVWTFDREWIRRAERAGRRTLPVSPSLSSFSVCPWGR